MAQIAEVEFSLPTKRPRLDFGQNGGHGTIETRKVASSDAEYSGNEVKCETCEDKKDIFVSVQNGVGKSVMAEIVKPDTEEINGTGSAEEDNGTARSEGGDDNGAESDSSDLSDLSDHAWRPVSGPMAWVQQQMLAERDPRTIINGLIPNPSVIPQDLDDFTLWKIIVGLLSEPERRKKLKHVNTIDDVVGLMKSCKNIMVLTGAGVSVSCGIPDFRSRDGIYARLAVDFPDLPDPQSMFDIHYFRHDPRPFFKFAKEIYPGQFEPSRCHKFIQLIERQGKLLRNYTQNIDTLEQVAGINNIIQCHGSFACATCMICKHKVDAEVIREDIFEQVIPHCPNCPLSDPEAIMKPDIVFFGESLPEKFHRQMAADKDVCDLLIVIGSSLKVRPVALIPDSLPASIPQILINREPLPHLNFDVDLLGDCDVIISELCHRLGDEWGHLASDHDPLSEVQKGELPTPVMSDVETPQDSPMSTHSISESSSASMPLLDDSNSNISMQDTQVVPTGGCDSSETKGENSGRIATKGDNLMSSDSTSATCDPSQSKGANSDSTATKGVNLEPSVSSFVAASNSHGSEVSGTKNSQSLIGGDSFTNIEQTTSGTSVTDSTSRTSASCIRRWWQSRHKSISSSLSNSQFLHLPPNRYIFKGAEIFSDSDSDPGDDYEESPFSNDCVSDREVRVDVISTDSALSSGHANNEKMTNKTRDLTNGVSDHSDVADYVKIQNKDGVTSPNNSSESKMNRTAGKKSDLFVSQDVGLEDETM